MLNISVIIPVYNAQDFLEKAVNSALYFEEVKEVLLINDGSSDNSLMVCEQLVSKNSRVKLLQHHDKGNHGAGATRNLGLAKASQEYIAFLDADDYYLPNRFDVEREAFKDSKIEGVFGAIGVDFLSQKGEEEFKSKFKNNNLTTVNYPAEGKDVFLGLMDLSSNYFGIFFSLIGLTVRKSSITKNKIKFNPELRVHQDTDFNLRLSYYCNLKTGSIKEAVSIRGVHDDNRITKIKPYSSRFYQNIFKLYTSLYEWSKHEKALDKNVTEEIKLRYLSFKIANKKGVMKWLHFIAATISHLKFIKTRYRFHALNTHQND